LDSPVFFKKINILFQVVIIAIDLLPVSDYP
jgi:hypothetical protein